jgi:hypothetical protein
MDRMVHYLGGPADGLTELLSESDHPFVVELTGDTDGFYIMRYTVAGRQLGGLLLTTDDVLAEWHQRTSPTDFMSGDHVVVVASGEHGLLIGPHTTVYEGGGTDEGWLVQVAGRVVRYSADEIRIATPEEREGTDQSD